MVRKAILGIVLLGVCGFAAAGEPKSSGFYLGGAAGLSIFDDDGASGGGFVDDEDTSLQIHAGYKILKYLAVEGSYSDFGSFEDFIGTFDVTALSVQAVGIIPFGDSGWELFGQLGVGEVTLSATGFPDIEEDAIGFGVGVRYSPTENFSLAIRTSGFIWEADLGGPIYDMSVGGTQVAAQFIF